MKRRIRIGMFAAAAVFGMAAMGCGSLDSAAGSGIDPQLVGTWLYGTNDTVLEVRLRSNNTGALVVYNADGSTTASASLKVRDGGSVLINAHNGRVYSGRLEGNNYILTDFFADADLVLSRAQKVDPSDTTWTFTNPQLGITYTFAKNGTYTMTTASEESRAQILSAVSDPAFLERTGTWSVSDYNDGYKIMLEPADGRYLSLNGSGKVDLKYTETYTAMFIDGAFYLDGLFYGGVNG